MDYKADCKSFVASGMNMERSRDSHGHCSGANSTVRDKPHFLPASLSLS